MLPLADTPAAAALQALSCLDSAALRPAAPLLCKQALDRWPGNSELLDALLTIAEELPAGARLEARALLPLLEREGRRVLPQSPALFAAAAGIAREHENDLRAFKLVVASLEQDPRHRPARSLLLGLVKNPAVVGALDDAMEGLAFGAFRGEIDKRAVVEVFDLLRHVAPLRRPRSLLGG